MSLRLELLRLAASEGANASLLVRRFGVSRKTFYKWKKRFAGGNLSKLLDQPRRPKNFPSRTTSDVEQRVLEIRAAHPAWGGRKIRAVMQRREHHETHVPAASTITAILRRHDRLDPAAREAAEHYVRFEHPAPNDLWQTDFKGDLILNDGRRCHPLAILDDHSRYALLLSACMNQRRETVWPLFWSAFQTYGLPRVMLMDNGAPWGVSHSPRAYTVLEVQLMSLDIRVTHGRPYHPQTQGREERFNRTLNVELLQGRQFEDPAEVQKAFDPWRTMYNHERPHEALGMKTPASRYACSPRSCPKMPVVMEYHEADQLRHLSPVGQMTFQRGVYKLSEAFGGRRVALRATATDGIWEVYFGRFRIALIDARDGSARMLRAQP